MAISGEIEKLERRWNENPSGLMFAPLAEAYRKAGNPARALEILDHGLRVHPDYVPALIVRGRCHLETAAVEEAVLAFEQALTRDPVNPIALRGLAEVLERAGRPREAAERLDLLLEVDRGDEDARAALDRLRGQLRDAGDSAPVAMALPDTATAETTAPAGADSQPPALAGDPVDELTIHQEEAAVELLLEPMAIAEAEGLGVENLSIDPMPMAAAEPEPASADIRMPWEPLSGFEVLEEPALSAQDAAGPEPEFQPEPEPMPVLAFAPVEGSDGPPEGEPETTATEAGAEEAAAAEEPPVAELPVPSDAEAPASPEPAAAEVAPVAVWTPLPEPVLWTPAPVPVEVEAPAVVTQELPQAEPELAEPAAVSEPPAMETPDLPTSSSEPPPPESPEAAALDWPSVEPAAPVDEAPVAEEAAGEAVLEVAVAESPAAPDEPALIVTESMAEVFVRQGHPALALAVYRQLAERSPDSESIRQAILQLEAETAPPAAPAEPARPAHRAADTGGRSVGQLLRAVLQAPPPVATSTVLPPAIEPPGEPARASHEPLSLGAVFGDAPVLPPPAAEPHPAAEPSYDEFFGAAPPAEVSAGGAARDPEGEDLRQFNDWLRGLKR